jgi:hypothetical protein
VPGLESARTRTEGKEETLSIVSERERTPGYG